VYENAKKPEYYFGRSRWKPRCLLGLSELWLQKGDVDKAGAFLAKLSEDEWTYGFPYRKYQVRATRLRGQILSAKGRYNEAETKLHLALSQAKALGNPTVTWHAYQALGNLLLKQNKRQEALSAYQAAVKVVQGLAEKLTDEELKDGYLKSEPVRNLILLARK
jgi:predicted negative regulator of RcsB-dependent stress response